MTISLVTDRLIIRDVKHSDADGFLRYMQHGDYWRFVPVDQPTTAAVNTLIARSIVQQSESPRASYFMAAADKRSGELLGEAILHIRSFRWNQGEIGWGVRFDYVGNGLATEIGRALLRFSFEQLKLHRVYAQCRAENAASRRIMVKLGMQEEGVFRDNVQARGEWWSSVQYAILSTDPSA
jgi:[ribosomal protein S5]-alanine N-acetyltransferase